MENTNEYALLALNSYSVSEDVVNPNNATPLPSGWRALTAAEISENKSFKGLAEGVQKIA